MGKPNKVTELKQLHRCRQGCAPGTRCSSPLNKFFHSLDQQESARRFRQAPEKYCREFGLKQEELEAVTDLDVMRLLDLGADIACMEGLTQVYKLSVAALGAEQTGMTEDEFSHRFT